MRRAKALRRKWRKRTYDIFARDTLHDPTAAILHTFLITLIIANTAAAVLETVPSLNASWGSSFRIFELFSFVVFAVEYVLRVWAAPEHPRFRGLSSGKARMYYVVTPAALVDLVSIAPFGLALLLHADLRAIALFRLVRFFKLARYSPGLASLVEAISAERHALFACIGIIGSVILVAASAMYVAEGDAQPDNFGSIPLSAWWAVVSVTTVGYGDAVPITVAGRIIAALTMVSGMILLALPVGIVASSFATVIRRRDFVVTWGMVARVSLFAELDAVAIGEILKLLSAHTAEPGELVTRKGEEARSMYFILSGEMQADLESGSVRLGEGSFFGEMALLTHRRRSANVRAVRRTQLLILDGQDLDDLLERRPEIRRRIEALRRSPDRPHPLHPRDDMTSEEVAGGEPSDASGTPS